MISLKLPLEIGKAGLSRQTDLKKSIDEFVETLMTTSCCDCTADPEFGFVFNSYAFENFNEHDGVIAERNDNKHISGNSRNLDTFAAELGEAIRKYEKRISNVSVTMTYITKEKAIYIEIRGTYGPNDTPYNYNTTIRVWK